jgi:hypothetical protein
VGHDLFQQIMPLSRDPVTTIEKHESGADRADVRFGAPIESTWQSCEAGHDAFRRRAITMPHPSGFPLSVAKALACL